MRCGLNVPCRNSRVCKLSSVFANLWCGCDVGRCLLIKHDLEDKLHAAKQIENDLKRNINNLEQEAQQIKRIAGLTEGGLKQELKLSEDRCNRLTNLLNEETHRRSRNEDRAIRCEEAEKKAKALEDQLATMAATLEQQRQALNSLASSDSQGKRNLDDSERLVRLLQADKQHLTAALQNAESRLADQVRLWEEEKSKSLALEAKVSKLGDQLVDFQTNSTQHLQQNFQVQLQRIREEAQRDLDAVRSSSKEIQDREIAILREAKQHAESDLHIARREVLSLQQSVQDLNARLTVEQQQRVIETSELRAEVKLRTFEVTSLGATFEEKSKLLREAQAQADKLQKELGAHR